MPTSRLHAGRRLIWGVCLVALVVACGSADEKVPQAPLGPAVQQKQLVVDGLSRGYRLFSPPSRDRSVPAPLVLVLHGVGNTGEQMVGVTQFDRLATTDGFLVAYPEGVNRTWNGGYCCPNGGPPQPDDVAFLDALIDDVSATVDVDPARIFAVGFSGGAIMAHRLGCDLSDRIAGLASVSGSMVLADCRPEDPVSVLAINGTADPLVPYAGGPTAGGATQPSPPAPAVVERWAELNTCPSPAVREPGEVLTTTTWTGCAEGTAVRLLTIDGGGHTWFAPEFGRVNGAVDATRVVWDFLRKVPPGS